MSSARYVLRASALVILFRQRVMKRHNYIPEAVLQLQENKNIEQIFFRTTTVPEYNECIYWILIYKHHYIYGHNCTVFHRRDPLKKRKTINAKHFIL